MDVKNIFTSQEYKSSKVDGEEHLINTEQPFEEYYTSEDSENDSIINNNANYEIIDIMNGILDDMNDKLLAINESNIVLIKNTNLIGKTQIALMSIVIGMILVALFIGRLR